MSLLSGDQSKKFLANLVKQGVQTPICVLYSQVTVAGVTTITPPTGATYCEIRVESTTGLRYRLDGVAPTASAGIPLLNLELFDILNAENIRKFKVIPQAAGTHTLNIQYFK